MKTYILRSLYGETVQWNLEEIIAYINSNRSDEWTPYDQTDWKDGLYEFTEYHIVKEI
jgi:hypothetical protein